MKSHDDKMIDLDLFLDPADPKDQALQWVSRLAAGDSDATMLAEFERWRESDVRNDHALANARRLWLMMGIPLEKQYAPAMASLPAPATGRVARRARPLMATAASLLLATGIGHQWWTNWQFDQVSEVGEQRTVALSDGSTMWLNTGSAADIQIDAAERHVVLARGEGYFDVVRDPRRPFTIDAGVGQVRVVGTAFGVYREGDDVVVTVQRGKVEVSGERGTSATVTPNQSVRVKSDGVVEAVKPIDAEQALSWRNGRVLFENRPIGQVLEELKRYDNRFIVVRFPEADHLRVSSMVDLARLDEWYDSLGESLPIEVRRLGPFVWISEADGPQPKV